MIVNPRFQEPEGARRHLEERLRTFRVNQRTVPPTLHEGIIRYVTAGLRPGAFLTHALTNDFTRALRHAHADLLPDLAVIAAFQVWELPDECWGSKAIVDRWILERGLRTVRT